MKVVLLEEVKELGNYGTVKTVSDGYARNFLLPQGLAVSFNSPLAQKILTGIIAQKQKKQRKDSQTAKFINQFKNITLTFPAKAAETGKLYSGIGKAAIIQAITKKYRTELKEKNLILEHDFKAIGEFLVTIKINEQTLTIKINIIKENEQKK